MTKPEKTDGFDNRLLFDLQGCLTNEGLQALCNGALDELGALEAAEHLSYCDRCLARYTALLCAAPEQLQTPKRDVASQVQSSLRRRSWQVFSNRYLTAAAAVLMAFGLWRFGVFGLPGLQATKPEQPTFSLSDGLDGMFQSTQKAVSNMFGSVQDHLQSNLQSGLLQLKDNNIKGE